VGVEKLTDLSTWDVPRLPGTLKLVSVAGIASKIQAPAGNSIFILEKDVSGRDDLGGE